MSRHTLRSFIPRILVVVAAASAVWAALASPAFAANTAEFIDRDILRPHNSVITGDMLVDNWRWYGIDVLAQLVIVGAETSLGDPRLGGALVQANNFGCMRFHGADTRWGELSSGKVWVQGKDWYAFPSPEAGMMALGRYLKVGQNGFYRVVLDGPAYDWDSFAAVYYGRDVPGFERYVSNLRALERRFRQQADDAGFAW